MFIDISSFYRNLCCLTHQCCWLKLTNRAVAAPVAIRQDLTVASFHLTDASVDSCVRRLQELRRLRLGGAITVRGGLGSGGAIL